MREHAEPTAYRLLFSRFGDWWQEAVLADEVEPIFEKLRTARIAPLAPGPWLLDAAYHELFIRFGGTCVTYNWTSMQENGWEALREVAKMIQALVRAKP